MAKKSSSTVVIIPQEEVSFVGCIKEAENNILQLKLKLDSYNSKRAARKQAKQVKKEPV